MTFTPAPDCSIHVSMSSVDFVDVLTEIAQIRTFGMWNPYERTLPRRTLTTEIHVEIHLSRPTQY